MSSAAVGTELRTDDVAGTTQFMIGAEVRCNAGPCGKVSRVVVDPVARVLTHLVVRPKHGRGPDRLVPVDIVDHSTGELCVRCSMVDFDELDAAEETDFLPPSSGYAGYGPDQAFFWPYYGLGGVGRGTAGGTPRPGMANTGHIVTHDMVPLGDVDVRRGEPVRATDGEIGKVEGLVIDPRNHHVTHVLLEEGHLWGKKDVAIPIRSVTRVRDVIEINMTKQGVQDLPSVDIDG